MKTEKLRELRIKLIRANLNLNGFLLSPTADDREKDRAQLDRLYGEVQAAYKALFDANHPASM